MIKKFFISFILLLFSLKSVIAQTPISDHTLQLDDPANSPPATIEQIAWLQGHWKGEGLGGVVEEVWSPPAANSMMGVFRFINEDTISFYEIVTLTEENGTLMIRLKHFHPDLKGWEEKEDTVDFQLVKIEQDTAWFDGFTIQRVGEDVMNIYAMLGTQARSIREVLFTYRRIKK